ncbi:MAG: hypothetical protein ACI9WU_002540, partial [Myxococcota bacterium]
MGARGWLVEGQRPLRVSDRQYRQDVAHLRAFEEAGLQDERDLVDLALDVVR